MTPFSKAKSDYRARVDSRKPPPDPSNFNWILFAIFALIIVIAVLQNHDRDQGDQAKPAVDAEQTAIPVDRHALRQQRLTYWNKAINALSIAKETVVLAQRDVEQQNMPLAIEMLRKGQSALTSANDGIVNDVPDGWTDVSEQLSDASAALGKEINSLELYADDQKPSDGADVITSALDSKGSLEGATHLARLHFAAMGGKWSDISDIDQTQAGLDKLFRAQ